MDFYINQVTSKTEFLCSLYRTNDNVKLWPEEFKPTDIQNGFPKAIVPKSFNQSKDKEEMDADKPNESITDTSEFSSDDDDDDEPGKQSLSSMLLNQSESLEMEEKKKSAMEQQKKSQHGNEECNPLIMNLSLTPKEIAQNSMSMLISVFDEWNKALHSNSENLWLAEELYRDPLLAVVILNRLPVCYYLVENLKKIFSNSCVNCSAERKLKYPKFAVGTYAHSFNMETVSELQGINEYLLNEDCNWKNENEFNEEAYFILKLVEITELQSRFDPIKQLWQEAKEKTNIILKKHRFYS